MVAGHFKLSQQAALLLQDKTSKYAVVTNPLTNPYLIHQWVQQVWCGQQVPHGVSGACQQQLQQQV
jgi:hypothetical protein